MKRTLLLAGCLLLCAGCAKKPGKYTGVLGKADVPPRLIVRFTFDGPYAAGDFAHASQKIAGEATALSVPATGCMGRILDADGDVDLGNCTETANVPAPTEGSLVLKGGSRKGRLAAPTVIFDGPTTAGNVKPSNEVAGECLKPDGSGSVPCGAWMPPMVAPTMRDVVTHRQELSCDKGYERWVLSAENAKQLSPSEWELPPEYHVCVTPAFIAELKKANGEK